MQVLNIIILLYPHTLYSKVSHFEETMQMCRLLSLFSITARYFCNVHASQEYAAEM